jgi:hypothetical protein
MKKAELRLYRMRQMLGETALSIVGDVSHQSVIQHVKELRKYLLQVSQYHWVRRDHVLDHSVDVLTNVIDHILDALKESNTVRMLYWVGKLLSELALTIEVLDGYIDRHKEEVKTDVSETIVK